VVSVKYSARHLPLKRKKGKRSWVMRTFVSKPHHERWTQHQLIRGSCIIVLCGTDNILWNIFHIQVEYEVMWGDIL
jgi:hypothetical protein